MLCGTEPHSNTGNNIKEKAYKTKTKDINCQWDLTCMQSQKKKKTIKKKKNDHYGQTECLTWDHCLQYCVNFTIM